MSAKIHPYMLATTVNGEGAAVNANITYSTITGYFVFSDYGYTPQGEVSGYTSGGGGGAPTVSNVIDKFPFAANANATDVGDLSQARDKPAGQSSRVSGYSSGGATPTVVSTIDKFPFASNSSATNVGNLTQARNDAAGQSDTISNFGYTSGGLVTLPVAARVNVIDKFPFAINANAIDVGDLTVARTTLAGQSSTVSGYSSGGNGGTPGSPVISNVIDKFSFSSTANATDVGDLTQTRSGTSGQSSTTHGYTSGGTFNVIDRFPFASNANATDVGDLSIGRLSTAGQSSTASGYTSGGSPGASNVIDKFPFASNANATDVGDLTVGRYRSAGQQV
jgi:hypothetical protein